MNELGGQTVVVIGGSSGIGLETDRRARAAGAHVILTGRNPDHLKQAAADAGADRTAAFDATDWAALQRFFADLPGPVDHVMVTAGGQYYASGRGRAEPARCGSCSSSTRHATRCCW